MKDIEQEIRFGKVFTTKEKLYFQFEFQDGEANILVNSGGEFIGEINIPKNQAINMIHRLKDANLLSEVV